MTPSTLPLEAGEQEPNLRELLLDARYAMSGLLALVRGECPALIDTDRGGGREGLKVEDCIEAIDAALAAPAVATPAPIEPSLTNALIVAMAIDFLGDVHQGEWHGPGDRRDKVIAKLESVRAALAHPAGGAPHGSQSNG